jgi:TolB protein
MKRQRLPVLLAMLLLASLLACGGSEDSAVAPAEPAIQSGGPLTAPPVSQPTTEANTGAIELSGRMLLVQNGTILLLQDEQIRPLLGEGNAWQPAWSPDGTRIAYIERGESYSDLKLANANGRTLDTLTINSSDFPPQSHERIYDTMWSFYPTWSPDGRRIITAAQQGPPSGSPASEYNLSIYSVPASGNSSRSQIYADPEAHVGQLAYAPDGETLVFTRAGRTGGGLQQIYQLDVDAGEAQVFPGAPDRSYDPAFSPNGNWLVFAQRDEEGTDIWALPGDAPADSEPTPRRLTSQGWARAPTLSPDGRLLAFLAIAPGEQGFDLWVTSLSIGSDGLLQADEPRQLTAGMRLDPDSGVSWAR